MNSSPGNIWEASSPRQLTAVLSQISNVADLQAFLRDVMTEKEILEVSSRLQAAKMLRCGATYTEIIEQTKLSSRTVARISEWMKNGCGGYEAALSIIEDQHSHLSPVRAD